MITTRYTHVQIVSRNIKVTNIVPVEKIYGVQKAPIYICLIMRMRCPIPEPESGGGCFAIDRSYSTVDSAEEDNLSQSSLTECFTLGEE